MTTFPRYTVLPDPNISPHSPELHRSKQTHETISKASYWQSVCPELHVDDKAKFQPSASQPLKLSGLRQAEIQKQILEEGFVHIKAEELLFKGLPPMENLARSIVRLMQHGWPASFFSMYDEAWAITNQVSRIMELATGNRCNMDLLAWYIDPNSDQAGFSPHRDRQPDDSPASFRQDGTPMYSTCWIPFTDACPDNSCLHMLPRAHDPGYFVGDDDASDTDPLPLAMNCKQAYQTIRAVPAEAGSAVVFTHRVIHWGSRGRKGYHTPRISFSFGCSGEGETWEPAYFDRKHLPFPKVALRASLASAQLIVYHERFVLDRAQLKLFHATYSQHMRVFSSKYQQEVNKEFVNATKEALTGKLTGTVDAPGEPGAATSSIKKDVVEESDDDDVMDRAMDAMLDAEMGGYGEDIEDDFDSMHADDAGILRRFEGKTGKSSTKKKNVRGDRKLQVDGEGESTSKAKKRKSGMAEDIKYLASLSSAGKSRVQGKKIGKKTFNRNS
mmetsp:Transcript_19000/g.36272  ORF Transcript_19000/g.36272 Transcript_19000/m.36272 type:complete len:500 (+) Transcript_19000:120-1619(+)